MWPFKTKQQKIEAVQDEITYKTCQIEHLRELFRNNHEVSCYYIDKHMTLCAEVAVLKNKLDRLTNGETK